MAEPPAPAPVPVVPPKPEPEAAPPADSVPVPPVVLLDDEGFHGHPPAKGIQAHELSLKEPVPLTANHMITQEVWLDPADPPKGIALQLRLGAGEEAGVYWEGEEEVFKPQESQELWYYGSLPELDKWTTLSVLAEDLGLEDDQVTGVRFVTFNGRALWDKTILTQAPSIEEPAEEPSGPLEIRPSFGEAPES